MAAKAVDFRTHNESVLEDLTPGDMVEFPRGAYSHWAVYIGNGELVHLSGDEDDGINGRVDSGHFLTISGQRFGKALVKIDKFWDVALDSKAKKNNGKDKKFTPLEPGEIIQNAMEKLGRIGYNVLFDNCEHFASWCRYGRGKSDQADTFLTAFALGTAIVTTGGLLLALAKGGSKEKKQKTEEL